MKGVPADSIITYITGERWMGKDTCGGPTRDDVAKLAYRLYEVGGRQHGCDIGDWLRAETELTHHYKLVTSRSDFLDAHSDPRAIHFLDFEGAQT